MTPPGNGQKFAPIFVLSTHKLFMMMSLLYQNFNDGSIGQK